MKIRRFLIMISSVLLFFAFGSSDVFASEQITEVFHKITLGQDKVSGPIIQFVEYEFSQELDINEVLFYRKMFNETKGDYLEFYDEDNNLLGKERINPDNISFTGITINGDEVTGKFSEEEIFDEYIMSVDYKDVKKIKITFSSIYAVTRYLRMEFKGQGIDLNPPDKIKNPNYVFNEDNSITYSYDFPADSDFSHLEIYQDEELIKDNYKLNSLKITGLQPLMNYNFKFIAIDTSGNKSEPYLSTIQMPEGPDLIAPLEISDINHVVSSTSVQFSYLLPIDDDFSHLQVWRNNVMIADNLKINTFNDNNLDYDTTYNYVFKSVDFTGNVSNGSSLTIKTMPYVDDIAPVAIAGVDVINGNSSLFLSWSASPENDVAGYNVYVDGVKRNGSPVAGNSFRMTNLVNGQEYSLQVSAVDTSGNESELTQTFVGIPDSAMLPVFKVDTDLSAVAKSTENWFSQLWLVTAFSASIPLAFFVGGRIKALFFA